MNLPRDGGMMQGGVAVAVLEVCSCTLLQEQFGVLEAHLTHHA